MPPTVLELLTIWSSSVGYRPAKEAWQLVPVFNVVYLEGAKCAAL
jgi:hypothetical protein